MKEEPPKLNEEEQKIVDIMQELYKLFPVPDHGYYDILPIQEQYKIIGQGEVMSELTEMIASKFDIYF